MHLLIYLLTSLKETITLPYFQHFTLNLEHQVIKNLFSHYEDESLWSKPLHELCSRAGTFVVFK